MRFPFVSRAMFDYALRQSADQIESLKDALAVERQRLSEALGTMSALRVAGAAPVPEALPAVQQDPVQAAIYERAKRYPIRVRRELIRTMADDAMRRLAAGEDQDEVIRLMADGIPVETLPI